MIKYWNRISAFALAGLLFLSGCSTGASTAPQNDQPNQKEASSKELSPVEVLIKANEIASEKSLSYKVNMKQQIEIDAGGQKQNKDVQMNMTVEMIHNPLAYHSKGTMKLGGPEIPIEMYFENNTLYQNIQNQGWTKKAAATGNSTKILPCS